MFKPYTSSAFDALYLSYGEVDTPQRMLVQVARSRASREQLAGRILVDTALPLSVLIALMSMIVWAGIRAGLAPLARMRALVEDRAPNDLAPLKLEAAPREVHALAKAINTLLAAVHESVSGQRRFISDAAHQLRMPLAGLKSQTELALEEATDPALRARLQRVHESATRSAHLVNQLLTLARAEPESAAAQGRSEVQLVRLAGELTAEWVPRARHAGVDLGFEPAQRMFRWQRLMELRSRAPMVLVDFWNDGALVGGCIAGDRYLHINSRGDVEPCVFIHYSIDNIREKSLAETLNSEFFQAIRRRQPYTQNYFRPCLIIDHPQLLHRVVEDSGAHPTHPGAETLLTQFSGHMEEFASAYGKLADDLWKEQDPSVVHAYLRRRFPSADKPEAGG